MKVIKLRESDIQRMVKRVLNEQEEKYLVSGDKFCMYGSCRVNIKAKDKGGRPVWEEHEIVAGGEGKSLEEAYGKAVEEFNKQVKEKGLTLTPPPIEKLEEIK